MIKPLIIIASGILLCTLLVIYIIFGKDEENNPDLAYTSPEYTEIAAPIEDEVLPPTETPKDEIHVISLPSVWSVARDMTEFAPGFNKEPIGDELFAYISGVTFPVTFEELIPILNARGINPNDLEEIASQFPNIISDDEEIEITRDELAFLTLLYYDFDGHEQIGEMICNVILADDFLAIFHELYLNKYPLERVRLVEEFGGSDRLAMINNNTTAFNYRKTATGKLSKHALGLAIDINPFYNPYIIYDNKGNITRISPEGSDFFIDRSQDFPHKIDENDLCYRVFKEHGFVWGGDWINEKDYMHFQKLP
ncbi:MAG: M15 family metallopeptidase [Lachnospiraceae bacterium]|nr:M15 family metallopeptidase [Lachnospiraceae bacterium]